MRVYSCVLIFLVWLIHAVFMKEVLRGRKAIEKKNPGALHTPQRVPNDKLNPRSPHRLTFIPRPSFFPLDDVGLEWDGSYSRVSTASGTSTRRSRTHSLRFRYTGILGFSGFSVQSVGRGSHGFFSFALPAWAKTSFLPCMYNTHTGEEKGK